MPQHHRALLLMGMLLVSGCAADAGNRADRSDILISKQNKVEFVRLDHDVHFALGSKVLAVDEADALAGFLKGSAVGDGDQVTIDRAGSGALTAARQATVLAVLKRMRVPVALAAAGADGAVAPNAVRVRVARSVVIAPRCPDWTKPEADEPANSPSSNFGCATESSLALMVANPADLVRGSPANGADGEALARGVGLYRSGAISKSLASAASGTSAGGSGTSGSGTSGGGQ